MFLVLLGAPGGGKGTQAAIISREWGLAHIASGDLFRQAVEKGTKVGQTVKDYMDKGMLVPDEVTVQVISERLGDPDCEMGCVFDGFPRTVEQAMVLDKTLASRGKAIDKAIYVEVPEEELLKRLSGRRICRRCQAPYHELTSPPKVPGKCDKCGGELYKRSDDNEDTVRGRLKVYFAQTMPVLDYYRGVGKLINVDGKKGIEEVAGEIVGALGLKSLEVK